SALHKNTATATPNSNRIETNESAIRRRMVMGPQCTSMQRIRRIARKQPVNLDNLHAWPDGLGIDECDRPRNNRHQLVCHVFRIHDFWRGHRFRPEDMTNQLVSVIPGAIAFVD